MLDIIGRLDAAQLASATLPASRATPKLEQLPNLVNAAQAPATQSLLGVRLRSSKCWYASRPRVRRDVADLPHRFGHRAASSIPDPG